MSLAQQVVVLAGTWVAKRKMIGRAEVLECEGTPALDKAAVRAEIGDVKPFNISVNDNGRIRHMAAIRISHSLILWEAPHADFY
ncbi:hypothetical protein [Vibrio campbellii]|uniref:hypothetical protein n=1 Tax=Vibrio campbellii TaxID=680 RepID=UPI001F311973|nr:hypothetical protein [Vibrio campbellii]MCE7729655.1 hypothetical protein [Vibrio campbellii]